MSSVTIRKLPEATHRALKIRAALHGRSTESEIRNILESAVRPRIGLGTLMANAARELGTLDFAGVRDEAPVQPADFT